jgi:NitT/TauT family transport system substrate-binding protein
MEGVGIVKKLNGLLLFIVVISLLLGACQPAAVQPTQVKPSPMLVTIKFVVLPIVDALPIYVADQKGYFAEQGIKMEFVPAASAAERDQLMAAKQGDGMINDLVSTVLYNRDQIQIQVVSFAKTATKQASQYRIVVAPQSPLKKPSDLAGVEIGISQASVIDYVTDRLLKAEGLKADQIKTIAVPKIPDRMALLAKGDIKAATLPEPFSTMAVQNGGTVILDDTSHPEYGCSVISFRKSMIDANPKVVTGFLAAVQKAVIEINANPTGWGSILRQFKLLPDALVDTYPITAYPAVSLPTEAQFMDVVTWALDKQLITKPVDYKQAVNSGLRP